MEISYHREGGKRLILDLSRAGQCLCGSKKPFADCCLWIFRHGPLPKRDGASLAVQFVDLFPDKTVDAALDDGPNLGAKERVLLELARMNHYVNSKTERDYRRRREQEIAGSALPEHLFNKVQYMYAYNHRGGMFPKTSLLEAMRRVCLLPRPAAAPADAVPMDRLVAFSIASGMKVAEFENAALGKAGDEIGALVSLQFAQRFYDRAVDLGSSLARCWMFMKDGVDAAMKKFPGCVDLRVEFEKAIGCSWKAWLGIGVPIRGKYDQPLPTLGGDGFFITRFDDIKDPAMQASTAKALEAMSATDEWLQEAFKDSKVLQYFKFYERPLYVDSKGRRFPFDMHLLERRVLDGTYWAVVERLIAQGDKKTRTAVNSTWGKVYEWYVHQLLAPLKGRLTVLTDWGDEFKAPEKTSLPDALVIQGDLGLVIEECVSFPGPSVIASGDAKALRKGLEGVWFGSEDRDSAKVRQLVKAVTAIRAGKLTINGQVVAAPKRIIPILAGLRSIPREPLVRGWIEQILIDNKLDPEMARSIVFLSVDELEELVAVLENGVPLAKAILPFTDESQARDKVGGADYRPQWLKASMKDAFDELALALFGKRLFDAVPGDAAKDADASP